MKRNVHLITVLSVFIAMLVAGCSGNGSQHRDGSISIARFEQLLFDTPQDQMSAKLSEFSDVFPSPLLTLYPDDPMFMSNIEGFVADSIVRDIYNITKKRFGTLYWLEDELTEALHEAKKLDDDIDIDFFATYVSASFDYGSRVTVDRGSRSLLVSIDQYAVGDMEQYSFFGLPMFIVALSDSAYLSSDIMAEIARQYIASPEENNATMLDFMIAEGKVLYFLDQVMPDKDDCLKIRYTPEQLQWAKDNESQIWTYFIKNGLLYEKDYNRFHNFVDDAPKTNAFKDSAPRTTDYIGWMIVRKYMENSNSTLKELFDNNDSQAILQASKYRP